MGQNYFTYSRVPFSSRALIYCGLWSNWKERGGEGEGLLGLHEHRLRGGKGGALFGHAEGVGGLLWRGYSFGG